MNQKQILEYKIARLKKFKELIDRSDFIKNYANSKTIEKKLKNQNQENMEGLAKILAKENSSFRKALDFLDDHYN